MKLLYASVFVFCLILPSAFGGSALVSGTDDLIFPTLDPAAVSTAEFMLLDGCHVRTQGGNLNVRSGSGRIIGKLPNGTHVRILSGGWAPTSLITAMVGRRRVRGWVATEFLADCD